MIKRYYAVVTGTVIASVVLYRQFTTNPAQYSDGHYRTLRIDESKSFVGPGSIIAVMNTPKMGTGGLFTTVTTSHKCHSNTDVAKSVNLVDCEDDIQAFRTHWYDDGAKIIQKHRKKNPEGKCLIISAIRNPTSWFASMFLQRGGGCDKDNWPTKEKLLRDFREFIAQNGYFKPLQGTLPALMKDFKGGSLANQIEIMDNNGGYSLLGPAPHESEVAGCELLLLSMDQSDLWPVVFEKIDPKIQFNRGASRVEQCPEYIEHIKVVADYELTKEEKLKIYQNQLHGGNFVKDWFDAYRYL